MARSQTDKKYATEKGDIAKMMDAIMIKGHQKGWVVTSGFAVLMTTLATLAAPTAYASVAWASIVYRSGSNGVQTSWYRNYPNQTDLIVKMQDEYPDWGYITFRSGQCGAVASFQDPLGDTRFGRGVAADRDAATNEAINNTYGGRYKLEQAFCQD